MFQIVGCVLALAAVVAILAAAPVSGLVFALATLGWVVKASPARLSAVEYESPQVGSWSR